MKGGNKFVEEAGSAREDEPGVRRGECVARDESRGRSGWGGKGRESR